MRGKVLLKLKKNEKLVWERHKDKCVPNFPHMVTGALCKLCTGGVTLIKGNEGQKEEHKPQTT